MGPISPMGEVASTSAISSPTAPVDTAAKTTAKMPETSVDAAVETPVETVAKTPSDAVTGFMRSFRTEQIMRDKPTTTVVTTAKLPTFGDM